MPIISQSVFVPSGVDQLALALGYVGWTFDPRLSPTYSGANLVSGTVWGSAIWLPAGAVVTGISLRNATAAAGTLPTLAKLGLADSTGKMLAASANTTALANWALGPIRFPFTAAYTVPTSGVYFGVALVNGTWGTTQPTPVDSAGSGDASGADGSNPPMTFSWTGQTDLPAIGSSLTITGLAARAYWFGCY